MVMGLAEHTQQSCPGTCDAEPIQSTCPVGHGEWPHNQRVHQQPERNVHSTQRPCYTTKKQKTAAPPPRRAHTYTFSANAITTSKFLNLL